MSCWQLLLVPLLVHSKELSRVVFYPSDASLVKGGSTNFTIRAEPSLEFDVNLTLSMSDTYFISPNSVVLKKGQKADFFLEAIEVSSEDFIEIKSCSPVEEQRTNCSINLQESFSKLRVVHSHFVDVLVVVVGWLYFVAWSISFYPQIYLNFSRKSVTGLNLDFVLLNTIGFSAYTTYNCLIYFNSHVQTAYKAEHPRGPIPVLLNDVVFAAHALLACVITGLQAMFLERDGQRVSHTCMGISAVLVGFAAVSGVLGASSAISLLQFTNFLSYIKMVVTLLKYIPQAIFNFRRKSTVGWSIGNILLDFTGGVLDLVQMALQAINVSNWSAYIGNPVKFGLGFVSIVFDVLFMVQHYVLYRGSEVVHAEYEGVEGDHGESREHSPSPSDAASQQPLSL